jgi:hypothetical protein
MVSEQSNLVLCLQKILHGQERPVLVSFPANANDVFQKSSNTSNLQLVGSLLQSINMENTWPVYVYQLGSNNLKNIPDLLRCKPHSYVIFIGPEKEKERLLDSLSSQLWDLSSDVYFNRCARFVIVVTGYRSEIRNLRHDGCSTLWIGYKIENFVIVTAKPEQPHYGINEDKYGLEENKHFDIYS